MIDTIVLMLNQDMFQILNHDRFSPSTRNLYGLGTEYSRLGGRSNINCYQNPTKTELKEGTYKPRLTVTKRMRDGRFMITLRIELSIPKLMYGNNFNELTDADFDAVTDRLRSVLAYMEVEVSKENLINAPVSVIHYSKNILLTDYTTPYTYLRTLAKLDIPKSLDVNTTDYRNGGHSFKCHTNSSEIVFYDKIKDLEQAKKSDKRALEKDNIIQLELFDELKRNKPFEVLRMEIRLSGRQKIRKLLSSLGFNGKITSKNLFNSHLSKQILLYYLDQLQVGRPPFFDTRQEKPAEFIEKFLLKNPKKRLGTALKVLGFRTIVNQIGVREFRELAGAYDDTTWYALKKEMQGLDTLGPIEVFTTLRAQIRDFAPLILSDHRRNMINNDKLVSSKHYG
jgi:hypothetical protein